jgi:hypothetical protein
MGGAKATRLVDCPGSPTWLHITVLKPQLSLAWEERCNIPGLEARKRENTRVCTAFMHRKSGEFSRVHLKHKVIEVSLVSMELMYVIGTSAINFDMTFVDLLCFRGK